MLPSIGSDLEAVEIVFTNKMRKNIMQKNSFFLKGDICWSASPRSLETAENSFLLCKDGKSGGVFKEIPKQYADLPVRDHSGKLIIPGLTDLHTHAPQFGFRALGMDMELLEWLNKKTFPEEAKYSNPEYAREAYTRFIEHVKKGPNTRLCVFATTHVPSTLLLMDMLEESGLVSLTGKVNMDRNCPDYLRENNSIGATREWLETFFRGRDAGRYRNTAPILTPRFIPCCSAEIMKSLGQIQKEYGLPVQSHLSENRKEVEWVRKLCPENENYAGSYADFGLLGNEAPTIMTHCVWSDEKEIALLAERRVCVAHCPQSNMNLSSGIAPVRRFLERGISMGLGSDLAGGVHSSIFRAMTDAIQVSKLRQTLIAPEEKALTLEEAFYLGTAGGGSFFGKLRPADESGILYQGPGPAGSFESGWDFDALIIDDLGTRGSPGAGANLGIPVRLNIRERLERIVYLSDDRHIIGKYVRGIPVF